MKKNLLILSNILLFAVFCNAQSAPSHVVSSQGGYAKSDDYSLEWTLGETVATTSSTVDYIYTQGFNQSFVVVGKRRDNGGNELITVFAAPNPVTANLTVAIETAISGKYSVVITDLYGERVYQKHANLNSQKLSIDMRGFASGVYLLQVYDTGNKMINTSKIIKL